MDNFKTNFLKVALPLIIMGLILLYFFNSISYVSHNGYVFQVKKCGNELEVVSGSDSVGEIIMIDEHTIKSSKESSSYEVNTNEEGYSIHLILPDGSYITHNLTGKRFVEFNAANKNILYGGNSGKASIDKLSGEESNKLFMDKSIGIFNKRELFISAIIVRIEVIHFYVLITGYFSIYILLAVIAYLVYLKPQMACGVYYKLTKSVAMLGDIHRIRVASYCFLLLSPLAILLLLLY